MHGAASSRADAWLPASSAQTVGFEQPILHGLCTLGIGARAVLLRCLENSPARLKRIKVAWECVCATDDEACQRLRLCRPDLQHQLFLETSS